MAAGIDRHKETDSSLLAATHKPRECGGTARASPSSAPRCLEYKPQRPMGRGWTHFKYDLRPTRKGNRRVMVCGAAGSAGADEVAPPIKQKVNERALESLIGSTGDMFLRSRAQNRPDQRGSADDDHKGEIDVLSWSWGMQARPSLGGGTAAGRRPSTS